MAKTALAIAWHVSKGVAALAYNKGYRVRETADVKGVLTRPRKDTMMNAIPRRLSTHRVGVEKTG